MTQRRILYELKSFENDPLPYILSINTVGDDLFHLSAKMAGPPESQYDEAVLGIDIKLRYDYPHKPPSTRFTPSIYHANVDLLSGHPECFPLQYDCWKPTKTIKDVLEEMYNFLQYPCTELCLGDPGDLFIRDIQEYKRKAREYTLQNNFE